MISSRELESLRGTTAGSSAVVPSNGNRKRNLRESLQVVARDAARLDYISAGDSSPTKASGSNSLPTFECDSSPLSSANSSPKPAQPLSSASEDTVSPPTTTDDAAYGGRPKRRKTETTRNYTWGSDTKPTTKGAGKDGQHIWKAEVQEAFYEALTLIPALGRKTIKVGRKKCGRNELVADFIKRKTGAIRTRKQVSSHLQVLKNLRKDDKAFLEMVREPLEGTEKFAPGCRAKFFFDSLVSEEELDEPGEDEPEASLCSPPPPNSIMPPLSSPSDASPIHVIRRQPDTRNATPSTSKPSLPFLDDASTLSQSAQESIAPAVFCLWTSSPRSGTTEKVLASFKSSDSAPKGTTYVEDIKDSEAKFPKLAHMRQQLSCPFLLAKIILDIPSSTEQVADKDIAELNTTLRLTTAYNEPLTSITTIYSYGQKVLSLVDDLEAPVRLSNSNSVAPSSTSHRFSYTAPFAANFWSVFLRGVFETPSKQSRKSTGPTTFNSFSKVGNERADFSIAIEGVSVVQEFVVRHESKSGGMGVSAGCKLGEVVLVAVYHFECAPLDDDVAQATSEAGSVTFTSLQLRPTAAAPPVALPSHSLVSHTPSRPAPRRVVSDTPFGSTLSSHAMTVSRSAPTYGLLGIEISPLPHRSAPPTVSGSTSFPHPLSSNFSPTAFVDHPHPAISRSRSYSIQSVATTSVWEQGSSATRFGEQQFSPDSPPYHTLTPSTSRSIMSSSTSTRSISSLSSVESDHSHYSKGCTRSPRYQPAIITDDLIVGEQAYEQAMDPRPTNAELVKNGPPSTNVDDLFSQLLGGSSGYSYLPADF